MLKAKPSPIEMKQMKDDYVRRCQQWLADEDTVVLGLLMSPQGMIFDVAVLPMRSEYLILSLQCQLMTEEMAECRKLFGAKIVDQLSLAPEAKAMASALQEALIGCRVLTFDAQRAMMLLEWTFGLNISIEGLLPTNGLLKERWIQEKGDWQCLSLYDACYRRGLEIPSKPCAYDQARLVVKLIEGFATSL